MEFDKEIFRKWCKTRTKEQLEQGLGLYTHLESYEKCAIIIEIGGYDLVSTDFYKSLDKYISV